jgi:hypothetical protein
MKKMKNIVTDNDEYVSLQYCTLEYLIDEREYKIDNYNY